MLTWQNLFDTLLDMSKKDSRVVEQIYGDWVVRMEWPDGVYNGGPGRLIIEPVNGSLPVGGLSSTVLRQIDFRSAVDKFLTQVTPPEHRRDAGLAIRDESRAGVTDLYLALLSEAYVSAVHCGQVNINEYLAELVEKPVNTIRGHIWQARKRDLLTGSPGRKGGALTAKARNVLEGVT